MLVYPSRRVYLEPQTITQVEVKVHENWKGFSNITINPLQNTSYAHVTAARTLCNIPLVKKDAQPIVVIPVINAGGQRINLNASLPVAVIEFNEFYSVPANTYSNEMRLRAREQSDKSLAIEHGVYNKLKKNQKKRSGKEEKKENEAGEVKGKEIEDDKNYEADLGLEQVEEDLRKLILEDEVDPRDKERLDEEVEYLLRFEITPLTVQQSETMPVREIEMADSSESSKPVERSPR